MLEVLNLYFLLLKVDHAYDLLAYRKQFIYQYIDDFLMISSKLTQHFCPKAMKRKHIINEQYNIISVKNFA